MGAQAEQALIDRHIAQDGADCEPEGATLAATGAAVWAIVGYWRDAVGGDEEQVAADYAVPVEAVRATLAYYRRHREAIDARLAANDAAIDSAIADAA
jgi:uncharacterized protein (DUF433 family)